MSKANRLFYLDNLRVAIIILVIIHHVGQAYGPTGGWWPIQDAQRAEILGPFFTVNRSYFMSLFFMISGYFTVMAFRSKGAKVFLKERLLRLGIPVLVFGIIMIPMKYFVFTPAGSPTPPLFPIEVGHLWFLEHLLLFSACYVLWQKIRKNHASTIPSQTKLPSLWKILLIALLVAVLTGIARNWFPIDHWEYLFGFFRVAFADVPRDLAFYLIGISAYNGDWFNRFSTMAGYRWLVLGLFLGAFWYIYDLFLSEILPIHQTGKDILYLVWEMLLCFSMCIGLTIFFREKVNGQNRLEKVLAQSQYGAYIFHVLFVLLFQLLLVEVNWSPMLKFILVSLASVPVTFLFCFWIKKPLHL